MSVTYQVTAPLVLVTDVEGVTHHVYQGAFLDAPSKEQVDHLLELGFIAKSGSEDAVIVPGTEFLVPTHGVEFDSSGHDLNGDPVDEVEPPAKVAPKADWVAYAVSRGADEVEAKELSKAELVELYG